MKTLIENYTFNKATKQVTFNSFSTIELSKLLLITNVTTGAIIYNFANSNLGGTVSGNVLTLTFNTSLMNNTDKLMIFYDLPSKSKATQNIADLFPELIKDYPNLIADFFDTFEDGDLKGWHSHDQYSQNQSIPGLSLSTVSARGYSLAIETPKRDGITAWARKSQGTKLIGANAKKQIIGMEMIWRSGYLYGGYGFEFGMDTQYVSQVSQPQSSTNGRRTWFKAHYRVSTNNSTYDKKWMYDSKGLDTVTYTDFITPGYTASDGSTVASNSVAYYDLPFNEPPKYSTALCALVIDQPTGIYEALYCNGFKWDLKAILGSTQAAQFVSSTPATDFYNNPTNQLPQYQNGCNLLLRCINRPTSSVQSGMYIDSVFLANTF